MKTKACTNTLDAAKTNFQNLEWHPFFILLLLIPGFIFQNSYEKVENTNIEKKPFDVSSSLAFFYALILGFV